MKINLGWNILFFDQCPAVHYSTRKEVIHPFVEKSRVRGKSGDVLKLNLEIPPNTTATVILPIPSAQSILINGEDVHDNPACLLDFSQENELNPQLELGSGKYSIEIQ